MNNSNDINILFSIIIPAYNVGEYIRDTIIAADKAADNRTEIIVINDGSTDDTLSVIKDVINDINARDRVICINQNNQGVSVARNVGIEKASGKYLIFCDGDDRCKENLISSVSKKVDNCPDMIVGGFDVLEYATGEYFVKQGKLCGNIYDGESLFKSMLFGENRIRLGSFAVKKEFIINNEILYTVGCPLSQDVEFMYKCMAKASTIAIVDALLVTYVKRAGSVMFRYNLKRFEAPRTMRRIYEYVRDNTDLLENAEIAEYLENGFYLLHSMYSFEALLPFCRDKGTRNKLWNDYISEYSDIEEQLNRISKSIKRYPGIYGKKRTLLFLKSRKMYITIMGITYKG